MADQQPVTDPQAQPSGAAELPSVEDNPVGSQDDNQRILARQTPTGTSRGVQQLGGPSLSADSGNKQILVQDNGVNQVLMGNQPTFGEGFYVTKLGIDATSATSLSDFVFNSNQNVFKIVQTDTISVDFINSEFSAFTLAHGLGFAPIPFAFLTNVTDGAANGNFPFPVNLGVTVDTIAHTIIPTASLNVAADGVNIYFECVNATGTDLGVFDIKYYLMQESSS